MNHAGYPNWEVDRPHLPRPLMDVSTSSMGLEMFIDPSLFPMKPGDDDLWDMSQPILCGFFIPKFQRPIVWDHDRQARFVESAYLGITLGTIVYNDASGFQGEGDRFHRLDRVLLDGQQRLNSIHNYVNDAFPIFAGTPHEHRWSDLNPREKRTFKHIQIGAAKIRSDDEDYLRTVYDRLNFGGVVHEEHQRATR